MGQNMGLPGGANDWAREVNKAMETVAHLQEMARRICNDFGLDVANPRRGLYTGATPSVDNPVQLKLPSLQDLDIRDAQDGDLLTFDGKRGKWVARRHDTVQLPKEFPQGDPDSYYVEPVEVVDPPVDEDVWFSPVLGTNLVLNPDITGSMQLNWKIPADTVEANGNYNVNAAKDLAFAPGQGMDGGDCIAVTLGDGYHNAGFPEDGNNPEKQNWLVFDGIPLDVPFGGFWVKMATDRTDEVNAYMETLDVDGNVLRATWGGSVALTPDSWHMARLNEFFTPEGAASRRMYIRVGGNYPGLDNHVMLVDRVLLSKDSQDYFDGNTPASGDLYYTWTGAPNNSTSQMRTVKEVSMPTTITLGQEFTIKGRHFPANTELAIRDDWWATTVRPVTDADGAFETTMTVPLMPPDEGQQPGDTGQINIDSGWQQTGIYIDVTYA